MSEKSEKPVGLLDIIKSVMAAFFGVQSNKNRERDFAHGRPIHYIIIGLVATLVFMLVVWGLVKLVLVLAQ
jgi:hypothetical protein